MHERHPVPEGREALSGALDGRLVPIHANKTARGQAGGDLIRVPAQSKRAVQVSPIRFYVQILDTFPQQHGHMLRLIHQNSSSSITAAMFSGLVSAAYTALQASLSQNSAWLLQPTTVTLLLKPA